MASARQLEANRRNWAKRRGVTAEGRARIAAACRRDRPWEHSTGPRTPAGKARSRANAVFLGDRCVVAQPWAAANRLKAELVELVLAGPGGEGGQLFKGGHFPEGGQLPEGGQFAEGGQLAEGGQRANWARFDPADPLPPGSQPYADPTRDALERFTRSVGITLPADACDPPANKSDCYPVLRAAALADRLEREYSAEAWLLRFAALQAENFARNLRLGVIKRLIRLTRKEL